MAKDVICTVDSCTYWKQGNMCNADRIEVNNTLTDERAYRSDETNCKTFNPKNPL